MNMLSLFPAIPLLMMLGLWLSKSTRQIHAVMVTGASLLLALAVLLVFRYLGLREAGESAAMLFTESHVWYAPLNIHYAVGVDGISVAMLLLSAIIVFTGTFASWQMKDQVKEYFLWYCLLSVGVFGFFISSTSSRCSSSTRWRSSPCTCSSASGAAAARSTRP